jgi:flagellar hook assembly protein FlgD
MKQFLQLLLCMTVTANLTAQITTPQIKARFGVDADLKSNYFNEANIDMSDEWYSSGIPGTGIQVIDTTGAAKIISEYVTKPSTLNKSLVRNMSLPAFTIQNNELLMDAVFVRDYHGSDSTIFASGSNKNGQNPNVWSSPIAQSVPDKNEILDAFMHVRRAGTTAIDSLWMFGGVSIENTTGNRYFDFEMYQTDIAYNRPSRSFTGYGADAGHTSWKFDAAGKVVRAGDIILTAEYGSSALTLIEARIWINEISLSTVPVNFNWSGQFDGASNGAQFGYASILPKNVGAFYSGLQSAKNTWGGPFKIVLGNNSVVDNYVTRQFMEFAVNLTKLGLDPVTVLGGSTCNRPFQKVLVKSRASTSFTSELKDFIAPVDFLLVPEVDLFTDVPIFCASNNVSNLKVSNAVPTSVYTWSTIDGHFADTTDKASVFVDAPGTYIVKQQLRSTCPVYASDTISITFESSCTILGTSSLNFSGKLTNDKVKLNWQKAQGEQISAYEIERSVDGIHFFSAGKQSADANKTGIQYLSAINDVSNLTSTFVYYRLKVYNLENIYKYSSTIKIDLASKRTIPGFTLAPNPATDMLSVKIFSASTKNVQLKIYDEAGKLMRTVLTTAAQGGSVIPVAGLQNWQRGLYTVKVFLGDDIFVDRMMLVK